MSLGRKKLNKKECFQVDVLQTCEELSTLVPSSAMSRHESKSKFSLYLLSHLLYGTVIIYREQFQHLLSDIRGALKKLRRPLFGISSEKISVYYDLNLVQNLDPYEYAKKSKIGGRKKNVEEVLDFQFEFDSQTESPVIVDFADLVIDSTCLNLADDTIPVARHQDITMMETMDFRTCIPLQMDDDLPPPTQQDINIQQSMLPPALRDDQLQNDVPVEIEQDELREPIVEKEPAQDISEPTFDLDESPKEIRSKLQKSGRKSRILIVDSTMTKLTKPEMMAALENYQNILIDSRERLETFSKSFPTIDRLFRREPIYIKYMTLEKKQLFSSLIVAGPREKMTAKEAWKQKRHLDDSLSFSDEAVPTNMSKKPRREQEEDLRDSTLDQMEQPRTGTRESFESFHRTRQSTLLPEGEPLANIEENIEPLEGNRIPMEGFQIEKDISLSKSVFLPWKFDVKREHFLGEIREKVKHNAEKWTDFQEITEGNDKTMSAKKFYLLLSLLKRGKIEVKQDENFGPIRIHVIE